MRSMRLRATIDLVHDQTTFGRKFRQLCAHSNEHFFKKARISKKDIENYPTGSESKVSVKAANQVDNVEYQGKSEQRAHREARQPQQGKVPKSRGAHARPTLTFGFDHH